MKKRKATNCNDNDVRSNYKEMKGCNLFWAMGPDERAAGEEEDKSAGPASGPLHNERQAHGGGRDSGSAGDHDEVQ